MDISLNVQNSDGSSTAYISGDPAKNVLRLAVWNNSAQTITLAPGSPTAAPPPATGPGCFFVTITGAGLIPPSAVPNISVSATGFTASSFGTPPHALWVLAPNGTAIDWQPNQAITIVLSHFSVPGPAGPARIDIDAFNLGTLGSRHLECAVPVINPPSLPAGEATLGITMEFASGEGTVFITDDENYPIANTCVVRLVNPSPTAPLVTSAGTPQFLFWFLCGDKPGYGALTSVDHATQDVAIAFSTAYPDAWSCTKNTAGPIPYWSFVPTKPEILGFGTAGIAEFTISNLITELEPGATLAYLQYTNVPGHNDGFRTLTFTKQQPQPGILSFDTASPAIPYDSQASLRWSTFAVEGLTLSYIIEGPPPISYSAPGQLNFNETFTTPEKLKADTVFSLTATDNQGNTVQRQVTIAIIKPQPRITSFTVTPATAIIPSDGNLFYAANLQDNGVLTFNWAIANPESVNHVTFNYVDQNQVQQHTQLDQIMSQQIALQHPGRIDYQLAVTSNVSDNYTDTRKITLGTWEDVITMVDVPTGTIVPFAGSEQRLAALQAQGWLKCDGSHVSAGSYPKLSQVIGKIYGDAGPSMIVLPDLRGQFLRGVDDGANTDPDVRSRVSHGAGSPQGVGSFQSDQLANHQHSWDHFFFNISWSGSDIAVHQPPDSGNLQNHRSQATNHDGGGSETRPKNMAVYYLIAAE